MNTETCPQGPLDRAVRLHRQAPGFLSKLRNAWRYITSGAARTNASLESENAALREQLSARVMDETVVTELHLRDGMHLGIEGGACRLLAESFAEQFVESGALNYLEMTLESRRAMPGERFVVTMQRCAGKTPHQLRAEAERELAELRKLHMQPNAVLTGLRPKAIGSFESCPRRSG